MKLCTQALLIGAVIVLSLVVAYFLPARKSWKNSPDIGYRAMHPVGGSQQ